MRLSVVPQDSAEPIHTVTVVGLQCAARRKQEEEKAEFLLARVTPLPGEVAVWRHSPGRHVATKYRWEAAMRPEVRVHGEQAYKIAKGMGAKFAGRGYQDFRADDLYALHSVFKRADWKTIEAAGGYRKLEYMGAAERAQYRLNIFPSCIKNAYLIPADTQGAELEGSPDNHAPYAVDNDCDFYVFEKFKYAKHVGMIQHSSFLAGGDVLCAGGINLHQGYLVEISNMSGHYQPGLPELLDACVALYYVKEHQKTDQSYVIYGDFADEYHLNDEPQVPRVYRIPFNLFLQSDGQPLRVEDFDGYIRFSEWHYTNPKAAAARGATF